MTSGMYLLPEKDRKPRREGMLGICVQCHARGFAEQELGRNDAVREQSTALVARAAEVIRTLNDRKLLEPSPDSRPAHPSSGKALVLVSSELEELLALAKDYDLPVDVQFRQLQPRHLELILHGVAERDFGGL